MSPTLRVLGWIAIPVMVIAIAGCQSTSNSDHSEAHEPAASDVAANLATLAPEDRAIAEAQGYCAVSSSERLGSMGVPIKVMVKDQPVFVCCKGCEKKAAQNADATLAKVAELKAKVAAEKGVTP